MSLGSSDSMSLGPLHHTGHTSHTHTDTQTHIMGPISERLVRPEVNMLATPCTPCANSHKTRRVTGLHTVHLRLSWLQTTAHMSSSMASSLPLKPTLLWIPFALRDWWGPESAAAARAADLTICSQYQSVIVGQSACKHTRHCLNARSAYSIAPNQSHHPTTMHPHPQKYTERPWLGRQTACRVTMRAPVPSPVLR